MFRPSHLKSAALVLPLAAVAIAAPAATAAPAAPASDLYVVTTTAGKVVPAGHGAYRITLSDPARRISAFSDRPARRTSTQSLKRFVANWKANGFAADHPNAALVIDDAGAGHDTYTYELSEPRITRSGALTIRAKRLAAKAPRRFGRASLFIDDSGAQTPLSISGTLAANQTALLAFNDPIDVEPTSSFLPKFTASNGLFLELTSSQIILNGGHTSTAPTDVAFNVDVDHGGSGPITGVATMSGGATVSISVNGQSPVTVGNGPFSLPMS
jgi:hypothetical protein